MSLSPYYISGYNNGLINNKKPFLIPDQAFQMMENAYVWRDRVVKREGLELMGRLRRILTAQAQANADGSGVYTIADLLTSFRANEPNAELEPESVIITIDVGVNETEFTDQGDGTFLRTAGTAYQIDASSVNYITGAIRLEFSVGSEPPNGTAVTADFNYYPSLPVMGIHQRERSGINDEQTIYFDQVYAYIRAGAGFQEYITGTTWQGSDSDFFWATNYRGSEASTRLFFVTNFFVDTGGAIYDPIRYTDNATWSALTPIIADNPPSAAQSLLYQARIVIPYYGRLLALNTWEGTTAGGIAGASNFFNRCRFSQIGDPTGSDAWRSDVFGKGGFIDAPTNEEIVSAIFFKNTLIVFFERTTWQLRYVGEYGLPFIWERVSSDFGSESTFSPILFDDGVLAIGDKAIISTDSVSVKRIDLDIPDRVYRISNSDNGTKRVQGIRDFQKELVYWTYPQDNEADVFPSKVMVYNYRNGSWAFLRYNITCFGTQQVPLDDVITWDRQDILWDDEAVTWDDPMGNFLDPRIVSGNQQGYIHYFAYTQFDQPSLSISAIDLSTTPIEITVTNHNIRGNIDIYDSTDEVVYIEGLLFQDSSTLDPVTTDLNDRIYLAQRIDSDTLRIYRYNESTNGYDESFSFTPAAAGNTYVGGGTLRVLPRMQIQTKDFNPFQLEGFQNFVAYIDFLTDTNPASEITVEIFANSKRDRAENFIVGNKYCEQDDTQFGYITNITQDTDAVVTSDNHGLINGDQVFFLDVKGMTEINASSISTVTVIDENTFSVDVDSSAFTAYTFGGIWQQVNNLYYEVGSEYSWHRFYATGTGQYLNFKLTYDNFLMNQVNTHQNSFVLNAMVPYFRKAGKNVF